jgi:hypothetical protein
MARPGYEHTLPPEITATMKHCILSPRFAGYRALAKTILFGAVLAGAAHLMTSPLCAIDRHWTGASSGAWSNPNNSLRIQAVNKRDRVAAIFMKDRFCL